MSIWGVPMGYGTTVNERVSCMYANDPVYPKHKVRAVRLWPYVLAGLICGLLLLAYLEPIPEPTKPEPVSIGPESSLYGPLKTGRE